MNLFALTLILKNNSILPVFMTEHFGIPLKVVLSKPHFWGSRKVFKGPLNSVGKGRAKVKFPWVSSSVGRVVQNMRFPCFMGIRWRLGGGRRDRAQGREELGSVTAGVWLGWGTSRPGLQ